MRSQRNEPPLGAVLGRGDLGTCVLFIFPLFLLYEVGVLFAPAVNGVDFITRHVLAVLGGSRKSYLLVQLGLAILYTAIVVWLRRTRPKSAFGRFWPMFLESGIYALVLGSLIVFVMRALLDLEPLAVGGVSKVGTGLVLSIGAGVHEELVFRLGLLSGVALLLRLGGVGHVLAIAAAFGISSLVFSAAHHVGKGGDPWSLGLFTYRALAGATFAALFYYRSLAHAVYTHALYDVYVMVLSSGL